MKISKKKQLLIVVDSLRNGGISSSLLQIINEIDYEQFELSLVLFHWEERYSSLIQKKVSLITFGGNLDCISATSSEAKKRGIFYYLKKKFLAFFCLIFGSNFVYSMLFRKISISFK